MIKIITSFRHLLSSWLRYAISWLESFEHPDKERSKFVDLAPTDEADKAGVYSEAILYATNNAKVSNIALTGPYGSGKSSIIQTFLKKYRRPVLQISLASFAPEADSTNPVNRQEIERSILQQILYGADANKLPLSRFKRIQSPGFWACLKSLYIMLGILALWYVFRHLEDVISGKYFVPFEPSNWVNLGIFLLAATFLWVTVHHFYVASFGLSLKSISLKDVEIKPASDDQASILNRHLDEIIYFFQSTKYELVIIEDLDRFNNADIFVTLREINSLVNENAGVKRAIKFLYALRDNMFLNTDRTKFFEFIIPVIPIINTSNSIDMVLDQGKRLELDGRLDRQFLREVSRYLNDLRLIRNIFNEYAIYVANLETDGENLLDVNKLLAILIYKNVYPSDFEQLHRGAGNLSKILNLKDELIGAAEKTYRTELSGLEEQLEIAERQTPSDLRELRQIYAMAVIEKLPANTVNVSHDQRAWCSLPQLPSHGAFDDLFGARRLFYRNNYNNQQEIDILKLQREVDPQQSYLQRKEMIESKATENKNKILRRISELRSKIATLRTTELHELLRLNTNSLLNHFETFGGNGDLARFLLLEGHIDDTYYQYISLFHSGRLSPNDNKFLIKIRAFETPEVSFPLDNPQEVIAAMRSEDFRQSYVLNITLVDTLLSERIRYSGQIKKLFLYLSTKFESCESFLDAYYNNGSDVAGLISGLANTWDGFIPAVIASPNNISHITQLVASLPEKSLKMLSKDFEDLPEFVSVHLPEILVNLPELAPKRLTCLDFEVKDLNSIKEHSEIVRTMFEKGLYELTMSNLEYIWQVILGEKDLEPLRTMNFTAIRSTNNEILMKRIELDFDYYFTNILLALSENTNEDASAILKVIQCDTFEQDDIEVFLELQTTFLPTLEAVPERLHPMLFQLGTIEPTWANCLSFIESKMFEANSLVGYLDRAAVRKIILEQPMPSDSASLKLRQFLVNSGSLSDAAYKEYAHALPNSFKNPPNELEPNKLRILIDEGKITFTKESFNKLADHSDLQVLFVAANIDMYLIDPDNYSLDDNFLEELLRTQIDILDKLRIVELMDLESLESLPKRSALIGPIIDKVNGKISNLNGSIIQSLIRYSSPIATQISLFNKYHSLLTDSEVRSVLVNLPKPFSEIKTGYSTPRLHNTPENKELVQWLDLRNIISSWREGILTDEIKINLYRH
ncbi:ATP-binding protein [Shewanella sp. 4t3-1-2LB]|uniref:YobI family P-loop NTPase n=1 Tax=Shewanella sp. 4t3-1-2LB TaxID=2817682 RepID=UPI001A999271|nr:ATP-binding protein [Shewanella sp. 4t3-1-2LB]MBO1272487.1 ATP-binding protein [Shewanella sp. 4t3-1-2LB]